MTASGRVRVPGFAGAGTLVRLFARRDRIRLPCWLAVFVLTAGVSAAATIDLYPSTSQRVTAAETFNRANSLLAMYGRIYDPAAAGSFAVVKLGGLGAVFVALLSIITILRHTRGDEESGRLELVAAGCVGRWAPLSAALAFAAGVNLVLALLTAAALVLGGLPAAGSLGFGLAWAGVGFGFAAVAAVAAQLSRSARGAAGLSVAVLGLVYLLRAAGDSAGPGGPGWLAWLSPIGWSQQFRPYAGDRWWVLLVMFSFALVVMLGAYVLAARRDLGTGLLPARPGPGVASAGLGGPLGLAWRLQRATLVAWFSGFTLLGLVFGSIASTVGGFLGSAPAREVIGRLGGSQSLVDSYLAAVLGIVAVAASAYGIQAVLRLPGEESALRSELVLTAPVGRIRWLLSHTTIALAGVALLIIVAGAAAGVVQAVHTGDWWWPGRMIAAALVQIPAAWVLTAVTVAAFGLAGRAAAAGWSVLTAFVLLGEVGPLLRINHWILDLSPFTHSPKLPGATPQLTPLVALCLSAVVLLVTGAIGLNRRDVV